MPQPRNSNREPLTRERTQGLVISTLVHLMLALLIIFVTFRVKVPDTTEEGLLVNFGFDETGEGLYEPAPQPVSPPAPVPAAADEGSDDAILTQDFEEAPEVVKKEPDPDEIRRQAEARAAQIRRELEQEAERKRLEQERIERLKREEEQKRTDAANARARNAFGNAANTGTAGQSDGIAGETGNQGDPSGTPDVPVYGPGGGLGNSNISYDLEGRKPQGGLTKPKYDYQDEGTVVVEVTVDRSGKVINARAGVRGTTTTVDYFLKVAYEAAMTTKFDRNEAAPVIQKGFITYIFKLN